MYKKSDFLKITVAVALIFVSSILLLPSCLSKAEPSKKDLESPIVQSTEPLEENNSFLDSEKEAMLEKLSTLK